MTDGGVYKWCMCATSFDTKTDLETSTSSNSLFYYYSNKNLAISMSKFVVHKNCQFVQNESSCILKSQYLESGKFHFNKVFG